MFKNIIYLMVVVGCFSACTRDDLCPEDTATTPNLIIVFNDFQNETRRKPVEGISIETSEPEVIRVLNRTTTDSVVIPLNVNSEYSDYRFIKTTITEIDTIIDVEKIRFSYRKKDVYVNRACGFRAEFGQLTAQGETESGNPWINEIKIKRDSVVDETQAHIIILH